MKRNLVVFFVIIAVWAILTQLTADTYYLKCDKAKDICKITKQEYSGSKEEPAGQFKISDVIDIYVKEIDRGTKNYHVDLQIDKGATQEFINFGYKSAVRANTVKMALLTFINNPNKKTFAAKKRCTVQRYQCY